MTFSILSEGSKYLPAQSLAAENTLATCDGAAQILWPLAPGPLSLASPYSAISILGLVALGLGSEGSAADCSAQKIPKRSEWGPADFRLSTMQPNQMHIISQSLLLAHMTC